ncbi:DEAD/DEAH box helicase [Candidatus Kaiserbacteria bacterium]|nr:DEAD/DEAH box helicase [Candidatus Kaiserbacteria bacterium]
MGTYSRSSGRDSGRSGGRSSSYGGQRSQGGNRGGYAGGSRGGYAPQRSYGRRRGGNQGQYIDPARFINKNVAPEVQQVFVPKHNFADFEIQDSLKSNILGRGYQTPTPIQDRTIPHTLSGKDVVGIANTGTGKTAAFLIPLIHKVLSNRAERVLVVVPTRELAIQIEDEFWQFADQLRIGAVSCVGGAPIYRQLNILRRDPHFVIGTPGRIIDLIKRGAIDLGRFNTVVLDEADRMLDMGFIDDIKDMLALMPDKRHTLFFSATLSREIEALIGKFLTDPVHISVSTGDSSKNVEQDIVRIDRGMNKIDVLDQLLSKPEFAKVLVFGKTKQGVETIAQNLMRRGHKAESIHGDKNQRSRQQALNLFKDERVNILVATDVAARGIDVPGVTHVINYDIPMTYADYVHRIGRTGRAGKRGKALTFID